MLRFDKTLTKAALIAGLPLSYAVSIVPSVLAQGISLNYDSLASLEEPLATEIGDVTFVLTGLLDGPVTIDFDSDGDGTDIFADFRGNFQISAETQLSNRWTVGAAYFGQYDTTVPGGDYTDNVAGFVAGAWGTIVGGNVDGLIREETRRLRGVGNAALAYDAPFGALSDWGGGYLVRLGPSRVGFVVDDDGNFDIGAMFSRPIGNKDYRFTARFTDSAVFAADGMTEFDSKAGSVVGEFIYGSSLFDLGVGYERLAAGGMDANRWYLSAGARHKTGALTFGVEGHIGRLAGESETSAALGASYDVARGLSFNLGLNYRKAEDIEIGGITFVDEEETQAIFSLRYSF